MPLEDVGRKEVIMVIKAPRRELRLFKLEYDRKAFRYVRQVLEERQVEAVRAFMEEG